MKIQINSAYHSCGNIPWIPFLLLFQIDLMTKASPKSAFDYPLTQMWPFVKPLNMEGA